MGEPAVDELTEDEPVADEPDAAETSVYMDLNEPADAAVSAS